MKFSLSEAASADSGKLEVDLPELFVATSQSTKPANTSVGILIDEVHYLNEDELRVLIVALIVWCSAATPNPVWSRTTSAGCSSR